MHLWDVSFWCMCHASWELHLIHYTGLSDLNISCIKFWNDLHLPRSALPTVFAFVSGVSRFPRVLLFSTSLPSSCLLTWPFQFNPVIFFFLPKAATLILPSTIGAIIRLERYKWFLHCQNVLISQFVSTESIPGVPCSLCSCVSASYAPPVPSHTPIPNFLYCMFLKLCFPHPWGWKDVFLEILVYEYLK